MSDNAQLAGSGSQHKRTFIAQMDTIVTYGWCEKDRHAKFAYQLCDSYEPESQ